eukprot:6264100-Amphidinium_carterae.3
MENFMVVSERARQGVGGLLVLVRKNMGIEIVSHMSFGARVLVVRCKWHTKRFLIVSAHPTRESPVADHQEFLRNVRSAVDCGGQWQLIMGVDLNARVKEAASDLTCAGSYTTSCVNQGRHIRPFLYWCHEQGHVLTNTFFNAEDGDVTTWKHPRSSKSRPLTHQIDFVIVGKDLSESVAKHVPMGWAELDSTTTSDHRPVIARLTLAMRERKRRTKLMRHPLNEQHMVEYERQMKEALRTWVPVDCPLRSVQDLQRLALDTLEKTKPKKRVPRKPWILPHTWRLVEVLRDMRKCKALLHKQQHVPATLMDR